MKRAPTMIAAIALAAAVLGMASKSPAATPAEFATGDVIEIDTDGGLTCFSGLDDVIEAISTDRNAWSGKLLRSCNPLDATYPYEIMKVNDQAPAPYKHIYCVNDVHDVPTNKSGCTWAVFPPGRTHLSSCKAGPALAPGTPVKQRGPGEDNWDVTERVPPRLPCQGHYLEK
jgi:hypothetical protein